MADNKTALDGTSTSFVMAFEDVSSVFYKRVTGAAAENTAAKGSPLLGGGRYDASDRTLDDGDVGALAINSKGILKVQPTNPSGVAVDPLTQDIFVARQIAVTFTSNTDTHASGDVVADTQVIAAAAPSDDVACLLTSMVVLNESDAAVDLRFHFFKSNVSLGTESSTVSLSIANAANYLGYVDVVAADYADLVNSQAAIKTNINLGCQPASGTDDVYVAVEARGAVTLGAADDLKVIFTFM